VTLKYVFLLFALGLATSVRAAPFITIGDDRFFLVNATSILREYVPLGQTLDNWQELAAIRILKDQKDPRAYLDRLGHQVVKSNPAARAELVQSDETKAFILDFMTFPGFTTKPFYAEWNLFRATYVDGRGLVVYQYARRIYQLGPDTGRIVMAARQKMYKPFAAATFEEVEDAKP
jgi:hypothetical protein